MPPEEKVGEEEVLTPPEGEETPPEEEGGEETPPEAEPPTETDEEKFVRLAKEKGYIPQSAVQPRIDELVREREEAKRLAAASATAQPAAKKEEYTEAELERMADYYGDANSENHNPQYARWAERKLDDIRIEKKTREILEGDKKKANEAKIVQERQQALVRATEQYPDLKNPQSALYIVADSIYRSKPWYMIDPEGLDIAVQKAATQLGVLPKSGSSVLAKEKKKLMKEQDKVSLAAGGRKVATPSPTSQLEKLEAKAIASGESGDWSAYMKAVNAHNKKKE